ncbi:MAG: hypothetical protein ACXAEU_17490 [Candidatus Hodarchaeales archaeon]|jgi:hypothetical protein
MPCNRDYKTFKRECFSNLAFWANQDHWKGECIWKEKTGEESCPFYDVIEKKIGEITVKFLPKGQVQIFFDRSEVFFPILSGVDIEDLFKLLAVELLKKENLDKDTKVTAITAILS